MAAASALHDAPDAFPPDIHIFTSSKQPWVNLEGSTPVVPEYYDWREFEDGQVVSMGAGDWLEILAGLKHRVVWTEPEEETVWLAVHFK